MFRFLSKRSSSDLLGSRLFDHNSFYHAFGTDLAKCREEVIIESPFITIRRMSRLLPLLKDLKANGVKVVVNTRDPEEHDALLQVQAITAIRVLQEADIKVLYTDGHHRKLAILDKKILWEGSLNILSQNSSCEIMRRTESKKLARQMVAFIKVKGF